MNKNKESLPVVFRRSKSMASIVLNRPEVLNSLNIEMVRLITSHLQEALADEKCQFIFFYGGDKGFCAGGDMKNIKQKAKEKAYDQARAFFAEEYALDLMINKCAKPVIVIADGITMGGGLGITTGADIAIATERTRMAMPETRIGFFPDVGATGWMFVKCPPGYPEYLGLTGYDIKGMECVRLGLATHFAKSANIPLLIKLLEEYEPVKALNKESLLVELKNQLLPFFDFNLPQNQDMDLWVSEYFAGKSDLDEILNSLSYCSLETRLCEQVFNSIKERSPTALVLTLKLLRHNEGRSLPDIFAAELKAAQYIIRHPDFMEGVRARLEDKDNMPRWNPDKISKVDLTDFVL
ncbi:MAG: enoyl-CoA hydratase/isomerase family protein [Smithella sp.]|nr:enoyl-CoA hydratase/isomerase family protein [Syntrophaceae bacterium]NTW77817.1 enoyl-CoA hydratase/isomerase family protein [Syntrophaceae bacterium]